MGFQARHPPTKSTFEKDRWYLALLVLVLLGIFGGIGCLPDLIGEMRTVDSRQTYLPPNSCINEPYFFDVNSALQIPAHMTPPFTYTQTGLDEIEGLYWDGEAGVISGKPTEVIDAQITVTVSDETEAEPYIEQITISIDELSIVTRSLPPACQEQDYSAILEVCGGEPDFDWEIVRSEGGYDVSWLSLEPIEGSDGRQVQLIGRTENLWPTPSTTERVDSRDYTFAIEVTDGLRNRATQDVVLTVDAHYALITPRFLPVASVGDRYSIQLQSCHNPMVEGLPPIETWSLEEGDPPNPLEVRPDGLIATHPEADDDRITGPAGVYRFRVKNVVAPVNSDLMYRMESDADFTLTVISPDVVLLETGIDVLECVNYEENPPPIDLNQGLELVGGNWQPLEAGESLPPGLTLSEDGSGTLVGQPSLPTEQGVPHIFKVDVLHAHPEPYRPKEVTVGVTVHPESPNTNGLRIERLGHDINGVNQSNLIDFSRDEDVELVFAFDDTAEGERLQALWSINRDERNIHLTRLGVSCGSRPPIEPVHIEPQRLIARFAVSEFSTLDPGTSYAFRVSFDVKNEEPWHRIAWDVYAIE